MRIEFQEYVDTCIVCLLIKQKRVFYQVFKMCTKKGSIIEKYARMCIIRVLNKKMLNSLYD